MRHWKVDRIEAADITELQFPRPVDFSIPEHLNGSFGIYNGDDQVHVAVRFSRDVVRYVEESNWHPSQSITMTSDGTAVAHFDLTGTVEVRSWILSFGRHAEVLAPESLREEIRRDVEAMSEAYQTQSP